MRLAVVMLCLMLAMPANAAETAELSKNHMVAVRASASERAGIIGWLPDGHAVTVLDSKGAYHRIDCYDMTGYVRKEDVRLVEDTYRIFASSEHADTVFLPALPKEKVQQLQQKLTKTALSLQGVPYVWGGTTPRGFDCSGFTQYVYRKNGLSLSRTCEGQLRAGMIIAKEDLQPGDIIIFQGTAGVRGVSHVGMYIGDGKLIHAGSRGITVVELSNSYFTRHYLCARRILVERPPQEAPEADIQEIQFCEETPY